MEKFKEGAGGGESPSLPSSLSSLPASSSSSSSSLISCVSLSSSPQAYLLFCLPSCFPPFPTFLSSRLPLLPPLLSASSTCLSPLLPYLLFSLLVSPAYLSPRLLSLLPPLNTASAPHLIFLKGLKTFPVMLRKRECDGSETQKTHDKFCSCVIL